MKILVFDGGGVFGIGQAAIIHGMNVHDKFDAFAGTSIGSAVAAACAVGKEDQVSEAFFRHWMPKIFKKRGRRFNPFNSKYDDKDLNRALQTVFRGEYISDIAKPLYVTAANVGGRSLKVFNKTDTWLLWEVIRAATAAETYFNPWKGFADGGVFANNPSMVAIAAISRRTGTPLSEMEILSIGTGKKSSSHSYPRSIFSWGLWLIQALLEGASDEMHDYFVRSLPVKRYERIQFAAKEDWTLDDPESMLEAIKEWAPDIKKARKILEEF